MCSGVLLWNLQYISLNRPPCICLCSERLYLVCKRRDHAVSPNEISSCKKKTRKEIKKIQLHVLLQGLLRFTLPWTCCTASKCALQHVQGNARWTSLCMWEQIISIFRPRLTHNMSCDSPLQPLSRKGQQHRAVEDAKQQFICFGSWLWQNNKQTKGSNVPLFLPNH